MKVKENSVLKIRVIEPVAYSSYMDENYTLDDHGLLIC
jgi:hypothetical protein